MDSRCRVELFGGLRVVQGEQVHTRFRTQKAASLLAYLALHRQQAHSREFLIELFWPDRDEAAGRDNLSTALSQLRRQLEPPGVPARSILQGDWQQVRLNPEAVATDAETFDLLVRQARRGAENRAALLQQAADLYRGELLPGNYADWAESARNRYGNDFYQTLLQLAELYEAAGQYAAALACADRAATLVPFDEAVPRTQARLRIRLEHASQTSRERAAVSGLGRTKPGKTLSKLAPPPPIPEKRPEAAPAPPTAPPLPLQLTRFYGREREREKIERLLQSPGVRLVTLLGPGGVGKTRLSLEVAARLAPRFAHRAYFVSLAGATNPAQIPGVLTGALRLPPDPPETALERAAHCLCAAPSLIVLDNLEQLIHDDDSPATRDVLAMIQTLLGAAPESVCLTTSRIALGLGGEHVFALAPLPTPGADTDLEAVRGNECVALYRDRAVAVRADFAVSAQNAEAVAAVCRLLEGMPLAIEMAAAWVRTLSPQKMRERLEQKLDLLVSRRRDLPARHQSLYATIEWSYELLTPELRELFARLSVFRRSWSLDAAEAVCGAGTLDGLRVLQEHSLILCVDDDEPRYRFLEPIREFAENMGAEQGDRGEVARRHALCFAALAEHGADGYDRMEADHDNLRAAFDWLVADPRSARECLAFAARLQPFWQVRGYYAEGRERLERALARPGAGEPSAERAGALKGAALLAMRLADYDNADRRHRESLALWRLSGAAHGEATAHLGLGSVALMRRDLEAADEHLRTARALYESLGDETGLADVLNDMGNVARHRGDAETCRTCYGRCLELRRRAGNPADVANVLSNLAPVLLHPFRDPDGADACVRECLAICRAIGDRRDGIFGVRAAAEVAEVRGEWDRAVILFAAEQALRDELGAARSPEGERCNGEKMARLREGGGATEFARLWATGKALSWEKAVAYALDETE